MAREIIVALTLVVSTIGSVKANSPVTFKVSEPVSIAGVPPVTLGPGTYILRNVENAAGMSVVQVLSKRQDYVYTTVFTIPAFRPYTDDKGQFLFSETPSGTPPVLHYWFPANENSGQEFISPRGMLSPDPYAAPKHLQVRTEGTSKRVAEPGDLYALREVLQRIESGKFRAARDSFRRNYFLTQNRDGAFTSLLLALVMTDAKEAKESLEMVSQFDRERTRVLSALDVYSVVASLPTARSNLKGSHVRRFLLNLAMEMTDDVIARTAILSFETHVLKGDPLPVEMALDRHREELAKERRREEQWVLAKDQIARLNDAIKSLLNKVGALEYSASVEARVGLFGSVKLRVVLNQRQLRDLDAIMERSHRTLCNRHSKLELLISQRNAAIARELNSLRLALRELDRQPGSHTRSQYGYLRNWEGAPASGVSRDLTILAEAANSPFIRPSSLMGTDLGYVQMNIAGSLARLAEWAGL